MDTLYSGTILSGATFNDTTKTITVSGTTALSGLTTDVTISSPANNQVLQYSSGSSKWINSPVSVYMSTLIDCVINSPSNGQLLQYNGSRWVNYTPATIININETGTLTQMYGTFGGGIGGDGVVQNAYYTVPCYIDNSGNSTMFTNYAVTSTQPTIIAFNTSTNISLYNNNNA